MPTPQFSDAEVLAIRFQHSRGRLDVRTWADMKLCSIETVRRVARGDTYRHVAGLKTHPNFGGLAGATGQGSAVGSASPQAACFDPPKPAPLTSLPGTADEPDEAEAAASFARLQANLAMPVPGNEQASRAATLLDELQGKASPPPKTGAELG